MSFRPIQHLRRFLDIFHQLEHLRGQHEYTAAPLLGNGREYGSIIVTLRVAKARKKIERACRYLELRPA